MSDATVVVTASPWAEDYDDVDNPLPWKFTENGFIDWARELFIGYENNIVLLSVKDAAAVVFEWGYSLKIEEDE